MVMCELDLGQRVPVEVPAASHVAVEDGSDGGGPARARPAAETMASLD
jgi:hypothetical protein